MSQAQSSVPLLPYTKIVGQERLKLALEIAYVTPGVGGVLIRGQRGTGKSTAARSFARMVYGTLPVTLPINATEDRVVGGWRLDKLLLGESVPQPGLLKQADGGLLFIDEVNLLDDHIVNIILDVTSTGLLTLQRDGLDVPGERVSFVLVGTMNPDEGELRPQLLDRFGLVVQVGTIDKDKVEQRLQIVTTVLAFDRALAEWRADNQAKIPFIDEGRKADQIKKERLDKARALFPNVAISRTMVRQCVALATHFEAHGQRADYGLALAARAAAALVGARQVKDAHVRAVAPMVLMHRRHDKDQVVWDDKVDYATVDEILAK